MRAKGIFGCLLVLVLLGCPTLTPADDATIASDGIQIGACVAVERNCKRDGNDAGTCWATYDGCMTAHGFRDAGIEGGK